jgi:hypothetical protein
MGRSVAQAVSRRLPTEAARARSQVLFFVDEVVLGRIFFGYLGFACESYSTILIIRRCIVSMCQIRYVTVFSFRMWQEELDMLDKNAITV